jgi:outer membrane protein assembly factor BamC
MRLLVLMAATLLLGGCGWLVGEEGYFRDRGDEYRGARSIPPMQIPEGKKPEAIEDLYAIPVERTDVLLGAKFEVPQPTPLIGDPEENVVRIQRLGEEQWILLDGAPGEVWPRIRGFLLSNRIGIEREDAANGVMETAWLTFKSNAERRERYRYRVEQGVQRNSTEVYVTQMANSRVEATDAAPPEWQERSMDAEREAWMVKELAGYLADTGGDASVSLLAQGISTVNKVYIVRGPDNNPVIDLKLPVERAWASLGRALTRAEFRVQDLDRSGGIYFVVYEPGTREELAETEEQPPEGETVAQAEGETVDGDGFLSGMFDWWGDDDEENPARGRAYRIDMKPGEDGVLIGVSRDDGSEFEDGEREFLLGLIKAHLA